MCIILGGLKYWTVSTEHEFRIKIDLSTKKAIAQNTDFVRNMNLKYGTVKKE